MSFGAMQNVSWKIEPSPVVDIMSLAIGHDVESPDFGVDLSDVVPDGWDEAETAVEDAISDNFAEPFPGEPTAEPLAIIPSAHFAAPRKEFLAALKMAGSAAPRKTRIDILKTVRLSVNGTVRLEGTDARQSVAIDRDWERDGELSILVNPHRLADAVKLSKSSFVEFVIQGDKITFDGSALPGLGDPSDFPPVGDVPADCVADFVIDAKNFRAAIQQTEFCTDSESTRFALGGILLEADSTQCRLMSTDSRRGSIVDCGVPYGTFGEQEKVSTIIPVATARRVETALAKFGDGMARIRVYGNPKSNLPQTVQILVHDVAEFWCEEVEGRFPDIKRVIPSCFNLEIKLNRDDLLLLLKQAGTVSTEESRGTDFTFSDNSLRIRHTSELGTVNSGMPVCTIQGEGSKFEATFDARYMAEVVAVAPKGEPITFKMIDHESAAVIEFGSLRHVMMPLSRDRQ